MNWLYTALISASVHILYLLLFRYHYKKNETTERMLFYIFLIGSICFTAQIIITNTSALIPYWLFGVIFATAILGYFANTFIFRAMKHAPNIGYASTIGRSFVIGVTILSIIFLDAEFNLLKGIGIIIALACTPLLTDKKQKGKASWLREAVLGSVFMTFFVLLLTFCSRHAEPLIYITYIFIFLTIFYGIVVFKTSTFKTPTPKVIILTGIIGYVYNLFTNIGYATAPNPGYVTAINNTAIIVVTILSFFIYGDHLTTKKIIGVIGTIIGLALIVI